MSLRKMFLITFLVFAVLGYGAVWLYAKFVLITSTPQHSYAYVQALVFVTIFLGAVALLSFAMTRSIGLAVRSLTYAIQAFAARNERVPVPISRMTPLEIRKLIIAFMDLLERVDAAHKRDAEVARIKSDFISTAAHQLRTPLTGIRWALEALQNDTLTEEQKALVASAAEKSHELVAIVGTLLNISSIESGKFKYSFEVLDITMLLQKVIEDFQHLAQERKVTLEYRAADQPIHAVRVDKERIKWVVTNLVENALRYTPAGGHVEVSVEPLGAEKTLVHVRDTGIGIAQEDRANIFERFYRAGNAIAKENEGNGLGLYIARTIAKDHGGDLDFAANTEGVGTTFTLSLPVAG